MDSPSPPDDRCGPSLPPAPGTVVISTGDGTVLGSWRLSVDDGVDLDLIGELCRLQLVANRRGWSVVLHDPSVDLRDVLEFVGLAEVLDLVAPALEAAATVEPDDPGETA